MILPDDSRSAIFTCCRCGSLRVEFLDWVDPQTTEYVGGYDGTGEKDPARCRSCATPTKLDVIPLDTLIEFARADLAKAQATEFGGGSES